MKNYVESSGWRLGKIVCCKQDKTSLEILKEPNDHSLVVSVHISSISSKHFGCSSISCSLFVEIDGADVGDECLEDADNGEAKANEARKSLLMCRLNIKIETNSCDNVSTFVIKARHQIVNKSEDHQ